jgi:hypothetical protein
MEALSAQQWADGAISLCVQKREAAGGAGGPERICEAGGFA